MSFGGGLVLRFGTLRENSHSILPANLASSDNIHDIIFIGFVNEATEERCSSTSLSKNDCVCADPTWHKPTDINDTPSAGYRL